MGIFGLAAMYIFFRSIQNDYLGQDVAQIELLLIIVLLVLAQTVVLIRVYEQHD